MFINESSIAGTWRNFERLVCRLLLYRGFENAWVVGGPGDKGADVIAHFRGKRYLVQAKCWKTPVGVQAVEEAVRALRFYGAEVPIVVSRSGFERSAFAYRQQLWSRNVRVQLWDQFYLLRAAKAIAPSAYPSGAEDARQLRPYQENAVRLLVDLWEQSAGKRGMIVMATGLGKTRVVSEFVRRSTVSRRPGARVLALAHTNELVYQLERAFTPFLQASQQTLVWNGHENNPSALEHADCVFACVNSADYYARERGGLPDFDIVFVDECHHVGGAGMYHNVLGAARAGGRNGALLVGATATPWRPDEHDLAKVFGLPLVSIDMVNGLRNGFLSNIDYRMYTTNFDWSKVGAVGRKRGKMSPKGINRTLFISEWDDGVINEVERAWREQPAPRAIVFCGSVAHAVMMRDKINARQFCRAEAVFSRGRGGEKMAMHERNRIMSDFNVGKIQALCCVDILNEGVDVPDVNIVVFQRVTHSRRIFIQQLGRGLRLAPGKDKVIVLDFVSDVRRFAAGLLLKDSLAVGGGASGGGRRFKINHSITFHRHGGKDGKTESFMREWLEDIAAVEAADEDATVLRYPPQLPEE